MARFNKGRPLPKDLTRKIEAYFEYYWMNDKNYAIQSEEDKRFMKELPKSIRRNVMFDLANIYRMQIIYMYLIQ